MYKSKQCNCDQCQVNEVDAIQDAVCKIKEGIQGIQDGLDTICCCRIREGINGIAEGLCKVKNGLADVIDSLKDYEFECDYRSNANIKNGVCDTKDGVKGVQEGLCRLQNCCLCEGIEGVQDGLQDLESGLCNLVKGVNQLNDERDNRKNNKCYQMNPTTDNNNRNEFCGCVRAE